MTALLSLARIHGVESTIQDGHLYILEQTSRWNGIDAGTAQTRMINWFIAQLTLMDLIELDGEKPALTFDDIYPYVNVGCFVLWFVAYFIA